MANKKSVTMKDIAKDTDISVSAVSMILNRRSDVSFSKETVAKVLESAKRLGYELSHEKKDTALRSPSSAQIKKVIAVFCPNIFNSYYATIAQSIEQSAYKKGYKTLIFTTFREVKKEHELVMDAIHMNVEGIIFTMIPNDPGFVEKVAKQFPIVVIGDKTSSINIDIIETNNYTAGVLVAEHLHSLGHRHIAFLTTTITPDVSLAMRYQRLKAIQNTYAKLCANEPYDVIVREQKVDSQYERNHLSLEYDVGYQLCMDCLEDRGLSGITAFVGNNDMVAYGIMDAVLKKGYKIPRDFSVCSFDNDFPSGLLPVSLTTVEHYMEEKGRKAFDTIYQKIQWNETPEQKSQYFIRIEYKPYLFVRDSTNRARQQKR